MIALDKNIVKRFNNAIGTTWGAIGADASEFVTDNYGAMEMVLDAGRMAEFAGSEGVEMDNFLSQLLQYHEFDSICEFFSKNISLI